MKRKLLLAIAAMTLCGGNRAWADVTVPDPVYSLTFEGATAVTDFGGVQHGSGSLVTSDDTRFGTYYQNWNDVTSGATATNWTNFLEVIPATNPWTQIVTDANNAFTISFWVNATVANTNQIGNYWGSLFTAYTETGLTAHQWPVGPDVRYLGQFHFNNDGAYADENGTNDEMSAIGAWDDDNNWHHFAWVFSGLNSQTFTLELYIDGTKKYSRNLSVTGENKTGINMLDNIDRFTIGGNTPIWENPDNAFAYDDIFLYSSALSSEQVAKIRKEKLDIYSWSAKAFATINNVKTEIDSWNGNEVVSGDTYNIWAKRVIIYGGKYYELNDNHFFGSGVSFSQTMGGSDIEYEFNYTLNEDIVYYTEGETLANSTASAAASGGAYCSYYAGPTTVSWLTANQVYRLETNVTGRNTNSSLEIYPSDGTTSFAKIVKNHATGYNTIYFRPSETSVRVGGPYYNDGFQNSLSFDYILIRKYDITNESGILGTLDRSSSWTQSDAYTLKKGDIKVFTFKNHGYGANKNSEQSWFNWIVYMYEGETQKAATRADFWDNIKSDNLGYQSVSKDGGLTKTWVDWTEFREDMDDATVAATLSYETDGTYRIHAESTGAKSGYIYYIDHSVSDLTDDLTIKISIEYSWIEMLSVENTNVGATISSAGWATLYTPYALDFSDVEGLTAYTATLEGSTVTLNEVSDVPANTGVVLKGDANIYSIPVIASSETAVGSLTGDATEATAYNAHDGYTLYGLALVENGTKVQFSPVTSGSIAAGKAFLKVAAPSTDEAKALNVVFADATGISGIQAAGATDGAIYNLAGQRVGRAQRGIYIRDGKKVVVK